MSTSPKRVPKVARRAWMLAQQNHIDLFSITPTGQDGRITEEDVLNAIRQRAAEKAPVAETPVKTAEAPVAEAPAKAPEEAPVAEAPEKAPEEAPVAETPAKEAEEAPVAETPAKEAEEAPVVEAPAKASEETPVEETPAKASEETPVEEAPAKASEETPVEETPAKASEEAPAEETPAKVSEETPVAETPAKTSEEAPVEETPAKVSEETPVAETPAENASEEAVSETKAEGAEALACEDQAERTAVVPSVVRSAPKEEHGADEKEQKCETIHDIYPHTDVIIPRTSTAPDGNPITVSMSFDASSIVRLHTMIKENGDAMGIPHVTINDMILFATAKILKKNKALNAHFLGDKIRRFDGVHLGFVVDTNHGMENPVIFDADKLSLNALAQITGALINGARAGKISSENTKQYASFTVSNLGTLGVEGFTPVLKAPQTGILGVCALQRRIKEVGGKDVFYSCIPLSLTFDPRALDTTSAAKFLRNLCVSLENFELLLLK